MPFQKADAGEMLAAPWTDKIAAFLPVIKYILVAAVALLAFVLIIKPLLRQVSAAARDSAVSPGGLVNVSVGDVGGHGGISGELPGSGMSPNMLQMPNNMTEADLTRHLADADAKKFAELLRNWLT
jgi:flagellar biosynthesis/type III secretory pathway M-ring protein FliF/YscJ